MTQVAILNIGDELLIGQVVNTNAAEMAKMLNSEGFDVIETLVVGDRGEMIVSALRSLMQRADAVSYTHLTLPTILEV